MLCFVCMNLHLLSRSSDKKLILKTVFNIREKLFCRKFWVRIILGRKDMTCCFRKENWNVFEVAYGL